MGRSRGKVSIKVVLRTPETIQWLLTLLSISVEFFKMKSEASLYLTSPIIFSFVLLSIRLYVLSSNYRYTNDTPRSDIFFSGSPTLPSLELRLYTQV